MRKITTATITRNDPRFIKNFYSLRFRGDVAQLSFPNVGSWIVVRTTDSDGYYSVTSSNNSNPRILSRKELDLLIAKLSGVANDRSTHPMYLPKRARK